MGCQIISGNQGSNLGPTCAVLFCSTTMTAFGPVMGSEEEAEAFIRFLAGDPRNYLSGELESLYSQFVTQSVCECGVVRQDKCMYCDDGEPLHENGSHYDEGEAPIMCELQPAPTNGERFKCAWCVKKEAA